MSLKHSKNTTIFNTAGNRQIILHIYYSTQLFKT